MKLLNEGSTSTQHLAGRKTKEPLESGSFVFDNILERITGSELDLVRITVQAGYPG